MLTDMSTVQTGTLDICFFIPSSHMLVSTLDEIIVTSFQFSSNT